MKEENNITNNYMNMLNFKKLFLKIYVENNKTKYLKTEGIPKYLTLLNLK